MADGIAGALEFAVAPPALTPLSWLQRAELIFADRVAVIDGQMQYTWAEFAANCWGGAQVLIDAGTAPGGRVGVVGGNSLMMLEAHFAVPAAAGVIVTVNPRLSTTEIAYLIDHAQLSVILADDSAAATVRQAVGMSCRGASEVTVLPMREYLTRRHAKPTALPRPVDDERAPIAINYTSGTTGRPKGVVVTHRSVYLQALAMALHLRLGLESTYLWTLPMFHANGWAFTWALAAVGCPSVLLARAAPDPAWRAIVDHDVTHLCAAPTLLAALLAEHRPSTGRGLTVAVGGSPPSPALIARARSAGWQVVHLYGLTETGGPAVICLPKPEWDDLDDAALAAMLARQGVPNVVTNAVDVVAPELDPSRESRAMGEIRVRGQSLFAGYWNDFDATSAAMADGWLRTGDVGVKHPDGYVELLDRDKDVIISGGENISSVEVERALDAHPAVLECAVVASPDERWGEVPVATVTLRRGAVVTEEELIEFVKTRIARFKAPRRVSFGPLPKGETGKVLKHEMRERLWAGTKRRIQ